MIAVALLTSNPSYAQMSLAQTYGTGTVYQSQIVNLSRSGKKIAIMRTQIMPNAADTIFYYNLDYSFWKSIPCPAIAGYTGVFGFGPTAAATSYVCYSSEGLFNTDTFLEAVVTYSPPTGGVAKIYVINENGSLTDSISANALTDFKVHSIAAGVFVATVRSTTGLRIYNLPGTIPCDICDGGGTLGLAKTEVKPYNITTLPTPNPSRDQVKITFSLPDGISQGELKLYDTQGKKIKSFQVDNRFGFIMLDNSELASGMYYYNIEVNGMVSSTQKIVVIK